MESNRDKEGINDTLAVLRKVPVFIAFYFIAWMKHINALKRNEKQLLKFGI